MLLSLDVSTSSWSVVKTNGDVPPVRNHHAATMIDDLGLMIIHGGESVKSLQKGFDPTSYSLICPCFLICLSRLNSSIFLHHPKYLTETKSSVNKSQSAPNIHHDPHLRSSNPLSGVCPSDTLVPYKTNTFTPLKVPTE